MTDQTATPPLEWAYDPAPETTNPRIKETYDLFINNSFTRATDGEYRTLVNPATGKPLCRVAEAGAADVDKAVKAARKAYDSVWTKVPARDRSKYIFRIARLMQERARELAVAETVNGGKPIRESRDIDIPLSVAYFFYYAGWADKLQYAFPGSVAHPVGVCGQIIPWNFPLLMAAWKIAPALAAGNTVVLKPAETTPVTALKLAEIIRDADLPPGVVNIIPGGRAAGQKLVEHPGIDKVAFTGSTAAGKWIMNAIAATEKSYTLELGGKAANIIFEDADIDQAVEGIINAIFFNQGHVCCAGSRLLVQEGIAQEVIEKLKDRIGTLILGNPLDKNTDVGAVNSGEQLSRITSYLKIGTDEGAEMWQPDMPVPAEGFWCRPTLFTNVSQSHRISQEEIFGPVLTIQTFRTESEAVEKANNTAYGLSAGVWTDKGAKVFKVTRQMRAGVIWANTFNKFDPTAPFGGYKESGMGREGGWHGLLPYVRTEVL